MHDIENTELSDVSGGAVYCDGFGFKFGDFFVCLGTAYEK